METTVIIAIGILIGAWLGYLGGKAERQRYVDAIKEIIWLSVREEPLVTDVNSTGYKIFKLAHKAHYPDMDI